MGITLEDCDMVMALWFCEIRAREMLNQGMHKTHHMKNPFLSRYEKGNVQPINLYDAKKLARRSAKWDTTQNAKEEKTRIANRILQDFGFLG